MGHDMFCVKSARMHHMHIDALILVLRVPDWSTDVHSGNVHCYEDIEVHDSQFEHSNACACNPIFPLEIAQLKIVWSDSESESLTL